MNQSVAQRKADLLARCQAALPNAANTSDNSEKNIRRFFVPGRIEFLGKHTDYAGGRSLLCTVDRGICLAARPRTDPQINLAALNLNDHAAFPLAPDIQPRAAHWSNYPMTVARRIARNFPGNLRGADLALASDLPPAAGMSSSSALIIAVFFALSAINNLPDHPAYRAHIRSAEDLAGYLGCIENGQSFGNLAGDRGVGTFGGSQDHTAILCSLPNQLVQYSFCPVRHEATLPFSEDHVLAIAVSGVVSEKTGPAMEAYNRAAQRVAAIINLWQKQTGRTESTLAAILSSSPHASADLRTILQSAQTLPQLAKLRLAERFEQFDAEANRIIPEVAAALRTNRIDLLGPLVDESQRNAETLLENQVPETIALCRLARTLGAPAASAFGAGFGGAVWALVPEKDSAVFLADWKLRYDAAFPARSHAANFFITHPGPPALEV